MLKRFLFTLALVLSCLGLNAQTKIAYGKTYVADDYVLISRVIVDSCAPTYTITWYNQVAVGKYGYKKGVGEVCLTFTSMEKLIHCLEYISTAKEDVDTMVRLDDTKYGNTMLFGNLTFVFGTGSDEAANQTALVLGNVPKMTLKKLRKVLAKEEGNVRNPCEYENQP